MKKIFLSFIAVSFVTMASAQKDIHCLIKTELGDITINLFWANAPKTCANFLRYVDAHLYDSSTFFRAVRLNNQPKDSIKIEVIQGGNVDSVKEFPPIPLESTNKTSLLHNDGTISMARGKPGSATSSFFICINDQPELDFGGARNKDGQGFAAFGTVIAGMDVVRKIQQLYPRQGQYFKPPVYILSIRRN